MGCLALSSLWCLSAGRELGATFDEPIYIERGLESWRNGSHCSLLVLGTMPLPADWDTLPLYLYERWTGTRLDLMHDLGWMLPWARAAALVFWWLLVFYGWLTGRALAGAWGGRLAAAALACEPTLLAHASLATTDIPLSACLLALVYHFHTGRARAWWPRIGIPGIWLAAALVAKASAMVFGPLCLLAVEAHRLLQARWTAGDPISPASAAGTIRSTLRSSRRDFVHIGIVGCVLMFVFCGCDRWPEENFLAWARGLPEGRYHTVMVWLAQHLRVSMNAGDGLVRQVIHNLHGHNGSFLLGRAYEHPVWYYFPLALAIKLSPPVLAGPAILLALRRRSVWNWALAPAGMLLLFSLTCRVQIGVRMLLPLVALLVVGLAAAYVSVLRQSRPWPRRLGSAACAAALLWTSLSAARVWPDGLCYTNELWGGTRSGYLCLSDSNYDWGQGLKQLTAWAAEREIGDLDVWYFGTDPAVHTAPFRYVPLHAFPIDKPDDVRAFVQNRYLAVGTTLLYGTRLDLPGHRAAMEFVGARQPVARTATFLIYDLAEPEQNVAARSLPDAPLMR